MKKFNTYIRESLENDNMLWLLDKWFETHDTEREEFMNIVFQCQKENNNWELTSIEDILSNIRNLIIYKNN